MRARLETAAPPPVPEDAYYDDLPYPATSPGSPASGGVLTTTFASGAGFSAAELAGGTGGPYASGAAVPLTVPQEGALSLSLLLRVGAMC